MALPAVQRAGRPLWQPSRKGLQVGLKDISPPDNLHCIQAALKAAIDLDRHRTLFREQEIHAIAAHETQAAIISSAICPMPHCGGARGVIFPLYLNPFAPAQATPMSCSFTAMARASRPLPMTETLAGRPNQLLSDEALFHLSSAGLTTLQPTPPAPLRGLTRKGKRRLSADSDNLRLYEGKALLFQPTSQPELI